MPTCPLSIEATQALDALIQPYLAQGQIDPVILEHNHTSYVVKFAREEKGRRWREWSSASACILIYGVKVTPHSLRTGDIAFEAQRLRHLKQIGLAVPTVYIQEPRYMVMEHCGPSIEHLLKHQLDDPQYFYAITDNLIALHQTGQWHGGAQMRNLTMKEGHIYRIDFEENTGNAMPLALAQAYDVLQHFNSMALLLKGDQELAVALLQHYLQAVPDPAIRSYLLRTHRWLQVLRKPTALLSKKRRQSKDVQRILFFADTLALVLD